LFIEVAPDGKVLARNGQLVANLLGELLPRFPN
jgi:hypothetical protein